MHIRQVESDLLMEVLSLLKVEDVQKAYENFKKVRLYVSDGSTLVFEPTTELVKTKDVGSLICSGTVFRVRKGRKTSPEVYAELLFYDLDTHEPLVTIDFG